MRETYQTKNGIYFTVRVHLISRDPELLSIEILDEIGIRKKHYLLDPASGRVIYGGT